MKEILKYIPPAGPLMAGHENLFLARNFDIDQGRISNQLKSLIDPATRNPNGFWIAIFPEGTYVTPKRKNLIDASKEFAKEHNLPVYQNLITPRTKGLALAFDTLGEQIEAVYDVTMAVKGDGFGSKLGETFPPSLLASITNSLHTLNPAAAGSPPNSKDPVEVHMHVTRIPKSELPAVHDAKAVAEWTHKVFTKKEALLNQFAATGKFTTDEQPGTPEPAIDWNMKIAASAIPPALTAFFVRVACSAAVSIVASTNF